MASLKFRFSWKVTVICGLLAAGMVRASFWQWDRHQSKQLFVAELERRLNMPVVDLGELLKTPPGAGSELSFRRVKVHGRYDFSREIVLRNRKHEGAPGVFVLTPLELSSSGSRLLVSRGYVPLDRSQAEARKIFRREPEVSFTALLKESVPRRMFAPKDPPSGKNLPWVDAWLRVDLDNIEKQMPYDLLPFYAEIMPVEKGDSAAEQILSVQSGRDEIFSLATRVEAPKPASSFDPAPYPIPVFDTVVPPARHLGYVYEWAIMAAITLCTAIVLQLRRPLPASKLPNGATEE